jgi:hypothetical protein
MGGKTMRMLLFLTWLLLPCIVLADGNAAGPESTLTPQQVAVVVNDDSADSVEVGRYYLKARGIPENNLVHVHIPGSPRKISVGMFNLIKQQIESQLPPDIPGAHPGMDHALCGGVQLDHLRARLRLRRRPVQADLRARQAQSLFQFRLAQPL